MPCGVDYGSWGHPIHLGNVKPVASLPEPWVGCTVALERVEFGGIDEGREGLNRRIVSWLLCFDSLRLGPGRDCESRLRERLKVLEDPAFEVVWD